jgi:hypothetical protein
MVKAIGAVGVATVVVWAGIVLIVGVSLMVKTVVEFPPTWGPLSVRVKASADSTVVSLLI